MSNFLGDDCVGWFDFNGLVNSTGLGDLTQGSSTLVTFSSGSANFTTGSYLIHPNILRADGGTCSFAFQFNPSLMTSDQTLLNTLGSAPNYTVRARSLSATTANATNGSTTVSNTNSGIVAGTTSWIFAWFSSDGIRLHISNTTLQSNYAAANVFTKFTGAIHIGNGFIGSMSFLGVWNRSLSYADMSALISGTTYSASLTHETSESYNIPELIHVERREPVVIGGELPGTGHLRIGRQ